MIQPKKAKENEPELKFDAPQKYLQDWIMMNVSMSNGIGLFQKRSLTREWKRYAEDFGLTTYAELSEEEQHSKKEEWIHFFLQLIDLCLHDKTYGSTIFGLIPMKKDTLAEKIANELDKVTEEYPTLLGLAELYAPLHDCAQIAYESTEF